MFEIVKNRAFHMETVYVNSFDPSRGCTLQAELIITTSSGSSAMGEYGGWEIPSFIMPLACMASLMGKSEKHWFSADKQCLSRDIRLYTLGLPYAWSVVQCLQRFVRPA